MVGTFADFGEKFISSFGGLVGNVAVAVLILIAGFIAGKLLARISGRALHELQLDRILKSAAGIRISMESSISKFVSYFIYFVAAVAALTQMGLTSAILYMISGAVILVMVISVILGIKDFIPNIIAGLQIYKKDMVREGDRISVLGTEGKVIHVDITETKLSTARGDIIFIPNSILVREKLIVRKK